MRPALFSKALLDGNHESRAAESMYWYYVIVLTSAGGVFISLDDFANVRRHLQLLYFFMVILMIGTFAGLRAESPDYAVYLRWFTNISSWDLATSDWVKDPAFVLTAFIVSRLGAGFVCVTLFFAAAALASQFYFSNLASESKWVTLFFFLVVCRTFVGSDMASIRSAVAIPLMSSAILLAYRGRKKGALLLFLVSVSFHLSALIGFPALVMALLNVRFSSRWWILSLAAVTVFAEASMHSVIALMSDESRLVTYLLAGNPTPKIYIAYIAARVLLLIVILIFFWRKIPPEGRMAVFCYAMGISLQILFVFNNALSWRSSDIFSLFDLCVLMLPLKNLHGGVRMMYVAGLAVLGALFFWSSLPVLGPYKSVFA